MTYINNNQEALWSPDEENILATLRQLGYYTDSAYFQDFFNYNKCQNDEICSFPCFCGDLNHLINNQPIIVMANSSKYSNTGVWIIDGYMGCYLGSDLSMKPIYNKILYHCVWGDGGDCNGYYYLGGSKSFIGSPDYYHWEDPVTAEGKDNIYYDLNIRYSGSVSHKDWYGGC